MNKPTTTTSTKTKTKRVVKSKQAVVETVVEAPVVEAPVVETPVVETVVEAPVTETVVVEAETVKQRLEKLIKAKQEFMVTLKQEIQELRKLQRDHEHALKDASKRNKKKRSNQDSAPRKPSGFASAVVVSDELYGFLSQFGVKQGEPIARTDVTRHIATYIKEHDLQNPDYRREILPDAALGKLFGPAIERKDPTDESSPMVYSYMRLQKYLSPHFPRKGVSTASVSM